MSSKFRENRLLRIGRVGATVLTVSFLAGCKTETRVEKIASDTWWVCEADEDEDYGDVICGSHPEKGLRKTCRKENKQIIDYKRLPGDAIVVRCGAPTHALAFPK